VPSRIEVDQVLEQVHTAGARIVRQAQDTFWGGYAGYVEDPDRHLWMVAYTPEPETER
jgi:uncharacterized protein